MYNDWIKDLKVGDRVGHARYHHWGNRPLNHGFGIIAKINGHGHIVLDSGKAFDKNGQERNKSYGGETLMQASDLEARLAEADAQRATNNKVKEIENYLAANRTGGGDYQFSAEQKAELARLVSNL